MDREEDIFKQIGERLKQLRKEKHLTQAEIAKAMNVRASQYHKTETGKVIPSLKTLIKIAKVLNVSLDKIVFGEEDGGSISNSSLSKKINKLENLSSDEQRLANELLDLVFTRATVKNMAEGYKSVPPEFLEGK